jgi:Ca-activated chloride channel homolog
MTLLWPYMLPFLVLVPVLAAIYIWMQRRRRRYALRYASLSLLKEAVGPGPGIKRHIPPVLFLASLAAMIFALARPQAVVQVPGLEGTVILAMDVSGSMLAEDMSPNRLAVAKDAARAFVSQQPSSVRIGVVAFSDNAHLVQAPTDDQDAVIAAINRLEPQRGTGIGRGLQAAVKALVEHPDIDANTEAMASQPGSSPAERQPGGKPGIVVLLSDGQNTVGIDPREAAEEAFQLSIPVYTVGIGTPEGAVLQIRGRAIRVRLDEDAMRGVAELTAGRYYNAQTESDLREIYQNLDRQLGLRTERTEITALFTGAAALLAIAGGLLSLLWFSRLP